MHLFKISSVRKPTLGILAFCLAKCFALYAQELKSPDRYLRQIIQEQQVNNFDDKSEDYYLLQLTKENKRKNIKDDNIEVVRAIDRNYFIVRGDGSSLREKGWMVKPVNNLWKLADPLLLQVNKS